MKRIESVLNNAFYLDCLGRNKEREAERAFCRHDFQHMVDVARISYILALESGDLNRFQDLYSLPDLATAREIIYSAGLMHDLARWVQYDTGEDHAAAGARLAGPVLASAGFSGLESEVIAAAIAEHRTTSAKRTWLGVIMSRADDLSRPCLQCGVRVECYKYSSGSVRAALLY